MRGSGWNALTLDDGTALGVILTRTNPWALKISELSYLLLAPRQVVALPK
jgi:hypothetical protein